MVSVADMPPGGARAVARCDALGVAPYSDAADGLYRAYLSPAYAQAQAALTGWMEAAGMTVSLDAAANLVGHYPGTGDGPPLIIGSHLDSVRDAGRYDGPLGIMLGVECVAALHAAGRRMPFAIEVYAFGDEEGSRFPAAMFTSRAVAGTLDPAALAVADGEGVTLAAALARFGRDVAGYAGARHGPALAYLEAHIEQGPVLEAEGIALGTVTGIAAQRREGFTLTGRAGHAGTEPMALRRDALAAAAAMIAAAEAVAADGTPDLVATVGVLQVSPGAANVVPGEVSFTLDVRAATDAARDVALGAIHSAFAHIAGERGIGIERRVLQDLPASPCDPALMALLDAAVAAGGQRPLRLVSGAGHDAMVMAALCPTAMLFVRCRDGISHNPAEHVEPADADAALAAMLGVIERLGERVS